jgi:hypothetical protein
MINVKEFNKTDFFVGRISVNLSKVGAKTALKYVTPPGFGGF